MTRREFLARTGIGAATIAAAGCSELASRPSIDTIEVVAQESSTVLIETSRSCQVFCDTRFPLGRFITRIDDPTGRCMEGDMIFWINDRATGDPLPNLPACDCPVKTGDRITWQRI